MFILRVNNKGRNIMHVLIVDDHLMFLEAIGNQLKERSPISKVSNNNDTLKIVKKENPPLLFLDITLDDGVDGFKCLEMIKEVNDSIKVVMLSEFYDKMFIKKVLEKSADGLAKKEASIDELINTIELANKGFLFLYDDEIIEELEKEYLKIKINGDKVISNRELEILVLISKGFRSAEIGEKLFISINTVETHRKKLLIKLNVTNMAQMVRKGFELGLLKH